MVVLPKDEETVESEIVPADPSAFLRASTTNGVRPCSSAELTPQWSNIQDPANPFNWSLYKKCTVTFLALLSTFISNLNGTMITVAHEETSRYFNISDTVFPNSYWPVTSWSLGGAVSGLLILPIMEDFGSRLPFLTTYMVFLCFILGQALARTFCTFIIVRFFSGACVSILANTAAGVITNIWEGDRGRTLPTSIFITVYLSATSMGPVLGAAILSSGFGGPENGWRWLSWCQLIWCGLFAPLYIIFFAETRGAAILAKRHRKRRQNLCAAESHNAAAALEADKPSHGYAQIPTAAKFKEAVTRPLYLLFTEPVLATFTLWAAFVIGTVFLFTQSTEQVFAALYGFTPVQAGYIQVAIVIGECLGWPFVFLSSHLYFRSKKQNTEMPGRPKPEARCYVALPATFMLVAGGMFVYGWTSQPSSSSDGAGRFPWMAPCAGLVMVGLGINIVSLAIADYILDSYARYAGSAFAALVLGENITAAFLPLSSQSLYTNLGFPWASSLLGFLALGISCASVCIVIFGPQLRKRSPFMESSVIREVGIDNA